MIYFYLCFDVCLLLKIVEFITLFNWIRVKFQNLLCSTFFYFCFTNSFCNIIQNERCEVKAYKCRLINHIFSFCALCFHFIFSFYNLLRMLFSFCTYLSYFTCIIILLWRQSYIIIYSCNVWTCCALMILYYTLYLWLFIKWFTSTNTLRYVYSSKLLNSEHSWIEWVLNFYIYWL